MIFCNINATLKNSQAAAEKVIHRKRFITDQRKSMMSLNGKYFSEETKTLESNNN